MTRSEPQDQTQPPHMRWKKKREKKQEVIQHFDRVKDIAFKGRERKQEGWGVAGKREKGGEKKRRKKKWGKRLSANSMHILHMYT